MIVYNASLGYHPESANNSLGQLVKQADTVMLGFPFEFAHGTFTPARRAADLAYYALHTDAGGGRNDLGGGGELRRWLLQTSTGALPMRSRPLTCGQRRPAAARPNFLTGAGGFLQTTFNGYTGLRVNASGAFFAPTLGEGMGSLGLHGMAFLGSRLSVDVSSSSVRVEVLGGGAAAAAAAAVRDVLRETLGAGAPYSLPLLPREGLGQRSQRARVRLGGCGSHVVPPQPLALVDADGVAHALLPGAPLTLPRQPFKLVQQA